MNYLQLFIPGLIFISWITIKIITLIIENEKVVLWYLGLKSPNVEVNEIIRNIFKKNEFINLKSRWIEYKRTLFFLKIQSIILFTGPFIYFADYFLNLHDQSSKLLFSWDFFFTLILVTIILCMGLHLKKTISTETDILEVTLKRFSNLIIVLILFSPIFYISFKNFEANLITVYIIYAILTIGIYTYIKHILNFLLPISTKKMYSTSEIILEITAIHTSEEKNNFIKNIVKKVA